MAKGDRYTSNITDQSRFALPDVSVPQTVIIVWSRYIHGILVSWPLIIIWDSGINAYTLLP